MHSILKHLGPRWYLIFSIFSGMWNLHVITLLIMLARNTKSGGSLQEDYVRPVTYTCRSLDHEIDNDDEVLDSLNHFSRPDSGAGSQLKRRQSSEDFLEMQAAREYQQYCLDHPDLMYHHHHGFDEEFR